VGIEDGRRHQRLGLGAGIAEHHALVAGPLVLARPRIDALGDVGRLRVDVNLDLSVLPMKAVLLVADTAHRVARDVFQSLMGD
jgi:hypothetical protein